MIITEIFYKLVIDQDKLNRAACIGQTDIHIGIDLPSLYLTYR